MAPSVPSSESREPRILVIGGFLGSGKTSVLQALARAITQAHPNDPHALAIIENEIGEVSVDDSVLGASYAVRTMVGGCVCCTLLTSLLKGISDLTHDLHPAYIVIEATGMASLSAMKQDIVEGLGLPVRICCVIDSQRWLRLSACLVSGLLEDQLVEADVALLTKIDLVDEATVQAVEDSVCSLAPRAVIRMADATKPLDDNLIQLICGTECDAHV